MSSENASEPCPPAAPPDPRARPWRIRTTDGRVRALGLEHIQIMLNAGLLTRDTCIAAQESENWLPVGEHEIWQQLRHRPRPTAEAGPRPVVESAAATKAGTQRISREVTPEMAERMHRVRKRETDRLARSLWLHRSARWANRARDVCAFLLFLCVGDLMGECIASEMGVTKLGAMLAVLTVGTGYVAWRTFRH